MSLLHRLMFELLYFGNPPWDTGKTPPELEAFIQAHTAGRALDLGCGTGTNAIYMAQHGWEVTAVDFVWRAIHKALSKAQKAGIEVDFRCQDVTTLKDIQGSFDLILDIGCFHTFKADRKLRYIQNLERLLAPGGTYLLYGFVQESHDSGLGLSTDDMVRLGEKVRLIKREDGEDQGRPSAWLTFQRESDPSVGGEQFR